MRKFSFAIAAATLLWALVSHAQAAEIVVLAAAAVEQPFEAVVHAFEHDTGNKVVVTFGSVGAIQNKLKAGASPDLVILSTALVTAAEKDGTARAVVGCAEIGVAVRDGTPAPDISTADAFKKTLLSGFLYGPGRRRDRRGLYRGPAGPTGHRGHHQGEIYEVQHRP
jgi:molybdate transport system substrate-binding protein